MPTITPCGQSQNRQRFKHSTSKKPLTHQVLAWELDFTQENLLPNAMMFSWKKQKWRLNVLTLNTHPKHSRVQAHNQHKQIKTLKVRVQRYFSQNKGNAFFFILPERVRTAFASRKCTEVSFETILKRALDTDTVVMMADSVGGFSGKRQSLPRNEPRNTTLFVWPNYTSY